MNGFSLAWPWMLLALPLPFVLRVLIAPVSTGAALRVPVLPTSKPLPASPRKRLPLSIAVLAWLLLAVAATRPQVPGTASQSVSGRDLMLAFDVSMSMATADLRLEGRTVDRLQAARHLAHDFLERRRGDRVGLLVFGAQAYLHTPLSFDVQAVRAALAGMEPGLAGRETALGDAIALAVKHLRALPESARVLVLLTDGASTAGTLPPERAVWLARREFVRVHVIGIGAASELDDAALKSIAERTGGSYRRAADSDALARFFGEIDRLEPASAAETRTMRELYHWPLSAALGLACLLLLLRLREGST
jgi:Ca-activated chloride channel family protein